MPKKELGQHWLHDQAILEQIAAEARLEKQDTVLEVGPGLGTLTRVLCEQAEKVVAVEFDQALAAELPERVAQSNLEVQNHDILDFDLSQLPENYKVVANIPYYLTSHLIRRLLESDNQPASIVLLVQKEVAERVVAEPGQMSILSVSAQHYSECRLGVEVAAEYFTPPPQVDSQVVVLEPRTPRDVDEQTFFRIVKAGFGEKRKKLANSLSGGLHLDKALVAETLSALQLGENVRAQELSLEQWYALYERLELG